MRTAFSFPFLSALLPFSRESDSESSGSGPVDVSVLGCGSVAGDSDWDSDLSDSDPSRSSRMSASCNKSSVVARPKRLPVEPDWDSSQTESEVLHEMFTEQDASTTGNSGVSGAAPAATSPIAMETEPVTSTEKPASSLEQLSTTKKVTWQFKPANRSVCTGSRKEKDNEFSLGKLREIEDGETSRPSPSSSSSSSPSSSSSGWFLKKKKTVVWLLEKSSEAAVQTGRKSICWLECFLPLRFVFLLPLPSWSS